MNKYIALSLLGAANAANSPLPVTTTFPKYPTVVAPASTDLDSDNVKVAYQQNSGATVNYGYYVAIRNALAFGITQTLKAFATGDQTLDSSVASNTRSFYQQTAAAMGSMKGKVTTSTPSTGATGAIYAICLSANLEDTTKCNGGVKGFKGTTSLTAMTAAIAYRVVSFIGITSKGAATHLWTWNNDILLASVMQTAWSGTTATEDGTKWCNEFKVTLAKAGTVAYSKATNGLNGKSKCTFQFLSEDYTVGPTIKFSKSDYVTALVQWIEWLDSTALDSNSILPTASAANYQIGAYPAADGVFLNPLTSQDSDTAWKANAYTFAVTEKDPSVSWAGSRGKAYFYSQKAGVFKDTQIASIESGQIINSVNYKVDENNKYNAVKTTYESDKTKYNDAVTKENERLKDIFKAAFDPAVKIPTRPTSPSPPAAFQGPYMAFDKIISSSPTAWATTATTQGNAAYLKFGTGTVAADYQASTKYASRLGYICMTSDNSVAVATTTTLASSGRVFGRLGQGTATLDTKSSPFYYGKTASGQIPGMMISLLPNAPADTGLAASGKQIVIDAKAVTWDTTTYNAPGQPSKSSAPMDPPAGAKFLSVGLAATLVAASLY